MIRIQGSVRDITSDNPVDNAQMEVLERGMGTFTDRNGRYELELPAGTHQIAIKAPGYSEFIQDIRVFSDDTWEIEMDLRAYRLDEVLLEAEATDQNISSTAMGVSQLSMRQMRRMPAFLGEVDVVKSILMLPGVSNGRRRSKWIQRKGRKY